MLIQLLKIANVCLVLEYIESLSGPPDICVNSSKGTANPFLIGALNLFHPPLMTEQRKAQK